MRARGTSPSGPSSWAPSLSPQRCPSSWSPPFLLINCLFVAMVFLSLPQTAGPETSRNQIIRLSWAEGSSEVTYAHTHTQTHIYACVHTHIHVCVHTSVHAYMCLHVCTSTYAITHRHTHDPCAHTCTQTLFPCSAPPPAHSPAALPPEAQDRHQHHRIFRSPRTP